MPKHRGLWLALVAIVLILAAALALYLLLFRPAAALEFFFYNTTIEDFNRGYLYHTALSWQDDGEVMLLPIGLAHPWEPGNNRGLPPRGGAAAAYYNNHIYVTGGDVQYGDARHEVFYTTIYTDIYTASLRLSDWVETTPLPASVYPEGVYRHDSVAYNGYLYVFGGEENDGGTSTIYDKVCMARILEDGTLGDWSETTPLPIPLLGLESLVLHGRIYILGGLDAEGDSRPEVYYATPDPVTGWISSWTPTTAPMPKFAGVDRYFDSAATVQGDRIYVYGGASGVLPPVSFSPYVIFAAPDPATGDIAQWSISAEGLPQNLFSGEGASYPSGLLLSIAGAWNNMTAPTGDVLASLVYSDTGQTGEWFYTIGMNPARFWHSVVMDEQGWLYSIGGTTGFYGDRLNDVQMASPYPGGGGGRLRRERVILSHTAAVSRTIYAPTGTFTSEPINVRVGTGEAKLTSLAWNTTITDAAAMTITMEYRIHDLDSGTWGPWQGPFPSRVGLAVTTTLPLTGSCDIFQYRANFSTQISTTTPLLNAVRIGVLAPPDLVAEALTVTGCDTCPILIPPDEPVNIEFTVRNQSTSLKWGNNFYAMVFITTDPNYSPSPPDLPAGCEEYNPPMDCPLIWGCDAADFEDTDPPLVLTAVYSFTMPGTYYLVAYVDYNDTPGAPPPIYDVQELNEFNNSLKLQINVGTKSIYLPLVSKGWNGP